MQTLAQIPFFKDAPDVDFAKFDRRCGWKKYDEGEVIIDYEDDTSDVYFILTGEVRVLIRTASGKEVILAETRAGQYFGELAGIDGAPRTANVSALTRAELCIVPSSVFREILFTSRSCCDKVLRLLTMRVRELDARLAEHSIFDLKHRLYAELLRLSTPRAGHAGQRIVSPPPFHHVVAARIGCRREQVTRELSSLASEGVIEKSRGGLVVLKPQTLQSRIDHAMQDED